MSIRVKSFLKDVGGAGRVTEARREKLKNASAVPDPKDPIRDLRPRRQKRSASRPWTGTFRCSSAASS